MKTTEFEYSGKSLHLYMNGAAMLAIEALDDGRQDGAPDVLDLMQKQTADGFSALCRVAQILASEGERCRRYLQYSPERIPTANELLILLSPMQLLSLRTAVIRALNSGWKQTESEDGDDIDTGLAELEKKTKL